MGEKTGISWCDHTWNPWQGCHKVSEGCTNCYMFREKKRYSQNPDLVVRSAERTFNAPLRWSRQVQGNYPCRRPLVFVCSWSDFFIEEADPWRDEAMEIMANCDKLIFLILTKRPERIKDWLVSSGWIDRLPNNVWLGVSVENDKQLYRFGYLHEIEELAVRFISYEPALGPLRFEGYEYFGDIDWLISGGESCSNREADVDWFRQVRDVSLKYKIPYFHKQNGGNKKINGVYGGCELDGVVWHQYPKVIDDGN